MVAALDARAVEDSAVSGVLVEDLALQDAAVFECKVEDVPLRCVRHRIESDDRRLFVEGLHDIANAAEVAMTPMQTPDAVDRMTLRHLAPLANYEMQGAHLPVAVAHRRLSLCFWAITCSSRLASSTSVSERQPSSWLGSDLISCVCLFACAACRSMAKPEPPLSDGHACAVPR
jgi:hypothetical protein